MNILFSTYSYYPYNYGGTEVYISGLALYLQKQGHTVTIIAGMPQKAFEEYPVFYEDEQLRTVQYLHRGINIIGVVLKDETTTEIYRKYRQAWVASWVSALHKLSENCYDILHLHGLTSPIGGALVEAAKQHSKKVKVAASYHVPVSCVKGTLLFGNKNIACTVAASTSICTACSISDKENIPVPVSKFIAKLLPRQLNESFPTALRIKFLVNEFVRSFHLLNDKIDRWFVFSNQIKNILLLNGVAENKTALLRHGVNPVFALSNNSVVKQKLNNKPTVFLYAGRFDKVKGFHTLIKAWSLLKVVPGRVLKIVGENQAQNEDLNKILHPLSKRSDIEWLGLKSPQGLAEIMKESHCVLIPSEWIEIGPLIFHEAIAAGCDVIAADLGGCAELAKFYNSKTTLFSSGNVKELATTISNFHFSGLVMPVNVEENNFKGVDLTYQNMLDSTYQNN